jgi:hypothetical protein
MTSALFPVRRARWHRIPGRHAAYRTIHADLALSGDSGTKDGGTRPAWHSYAFSRLPAFSAGG